MILEYVQRCLILFLWMKILLYLVPKKIFSKYIAFFAGVVLVIAMIQPLLHGFWIDKMFEESEYKVWEAELSGLSEDAALLERGAAEVLKKYEDEEETMLHVYGECDIKHEIEKIEISVDGQVEIGNAE